MRGLGKYGFWAPYGFWAGFETNPGKSHLSGSWSGLQNLHVTLRFVILCVVCFDGLRHRSGRFWQVSRLARRMQGW
jgi:hypothetical protein